MKILTILGFFFLILVDLLSYYGESARISLPFQLFVGTYKFFTDFESRLHKYSLHYLQLHLHHDSSGFGKSPKHGINSLFEDHQDEAS